MNDYIIRGTAANDQVRFFAAYTKDVVETARQKHNTSPVATAALGNPPSASATNNASDEIGRPQSQQSVIDPF